jgi:hypothetical protein
MFVIVFCVISVYLVCILLNLKTNRGFASSNIPSPKKISVLHNCLDVYGLNLNGFFKKFEQLHEECGDVFHLTFHAFDCGTIFVANYEVANVLSHHAPYRTDVSMYQQLSRWIGTDGFFLAAGNQKKIRMKFMMPFFNKKFHQLYMNITSSHVDAFRDIFLRPKSSTQIDFFPHIINVALDITFGLKILTTQINQLKIRY